MSPDLDDLIVLAGLALFALGTGAIDWRIPVTVIGAVLLALGMWRLRPWAS